MTTSLAAALFARAAQKLDIRLRERQTSITASELSRARAPDCALASLGLDPTGG